MTFATEKAAMFRREVWLLKLRIDQCTLTFGTGACTATGTPCYYSRTTCKDIANYDKGEKIYRYCKKRGLPVDNAFPLIRKLEYTATKIDPKNFLTNRGVVTIVLEDERPHEKANPDKSPSNAETTGTYWRNWLARNPNYQDRYAEIWHGFEGVPENEWELYFFGLINNIELNADSVEIDIKDILKMTERLSHTNQSDDNVLQADYTGGTDIEVKDASEFPNPANQGNVFYPKHEIVKVGDKNAKYSGRNLTTNKLTGAAYVYGSSGTVAAGETVKHALVYAEDDGGFGEGCPFDIIALDLLCNRGKINGAFIATVDKSITLTAGISASDTKIPVGDISHFPEQGIIRIGNEMIRYGSKTETNKLQVKGGVDGRGQYRTDAASHLINAPVLITEFTREMALWSQGQLYERKIEKPVKIKTLLQELRTQALFHVWQGEDSLVHCRSVRPPMYDEVTKTLVEGENFVRDSFVLDRNDSSIETRAQVYFDPLPGKDNPGKDPLNYQKDLLLIQQEVEDETYYNMDRMYEVFGSWITRLTEATVLASRSVARYMIGAPLATFETELKDSDLKVGDQFYMTHRFLVKADGMLDTNRLFEVIKKVARGIGGYVYEAIDTRLRYRYPIISPTTMTGDYDTASEEEQEKYGWIGNADNEVGAALEEGYRMW